MEGQEKGNGGSKGNSKRWERPMIIIEQLQLPGSIRSVSIGPGGERVAVVIENYNPSAKRSKSRRSEQTQYCYRLSDGRLHPEGTTPLRLPPEWQGGSRKARYTFPETRILFRDEQTILIARRMQCIDPDAEDPW